MAILEGAYGWANVVALHGAKSARHLCEICSWSLTCARPARWPALCLMRYVGYVHRCISLQTRSLSADRCLVRKLMGRPFSARMFQLSEPAMRRLAGLLLWISARLECEFLWAGGAVSTEGIAALEIASPDDAGSNDVQHRLIPRT